jgi:hypothetical protein
MQDCTAMHWWVHGLVCSNWLPIAAFGCRLQQFAADCSNSLPIAAIRCRLQQLAADCTCCCTGGAVTVSAELVVWCAEA